MRKHLHLFAALTAGFAALALAPSAHAEDFSLHLEPAVAIPVSHPQDNIFGPGLGLAARGLFNLNRNWAVGPAVSSIYLPRLQDTALAAGEFWEFGGTLRLQGDRSVNTHGQWLTGWSPWVDVGAAAAYTGHIPLLALNVGIGEEVATDAAHEAWMGPFMRYTHAFQTADQTAGLLLNRNDINIFEAGWSVSFDFPPHVRTRRVVKHDYEVVVIEKPVVVNRVVAAAAPEEFSLSEHVFFDWDSASLRWESRDKLDAVAAKLNEHPKMTISVQGHASADGQLAHNVKLSAERAEAVVSYLAAHGVDRSRLRGESFGVDHPAVAAACTDRSSEACQRSRRVEFTVVFTSVK